TPKQVFEHTTIADLGAVAGTAQAIEPIQGVVTGSVPLMPIQRWFFEQKRQHPHHFNQAKMFEAAEELDPVLLARSIEYLVQQHDSLRLRFENDGGEWRQINTGLSKDQAFERLDLSEMNGASQVLAIEARAAEMQATLNLTDGPLFRVVLFELGPRNPSRLLIIAHHLVIDAISWRILLEDLMNIYHTLSRGGNVALALKTAA